MTSVVGPQVLVGIYNFIEFVVGIRKVVGPQVLVGIYNTLNSLSIGIPSCRTSGFGRYLQQVICNTRIQ